MTVPASTRLRVALVGAGYVATHHLAALKQLDFVDVVGICDPQLPAAQALADRFGVKRVAAHMSGVPTGGIFGFVHVLNMDKINVFDLPKSELMHNGDSGTLRNGFNQANLERLLSYSSDGSRITAKDLADANQKQMEADPGEAGRKFGVAEYSILLNIFGKKDESGEKYLTKDDVTKIFKNQSKDQFATRVPISGTIGDKSMSPVEAILGILRNAFVEAYKPSLEHLTERPKDE